jgi:hypothetical protein
VYPLWYYVYCELCSVPSIGGGRERSADEKHNISDQRRAATLLTVPLEGVAYPHSTSLGFCVRTATRRRPYAQHPGLSTSYGCRQQGVSDENLSGDCCWTLARVVDLRALQQTRDDERPISDNIFSFIFLPILCC